MTAEQDALVSRLRVLLAEVPTHREVSMFGGRAFLVNGKMIVSAQKDGGLLVRIAADRHAELLRHPGSKQAEMGTGREMGPGWINVSADSIGDDEGLELWLRAAMEYNREVTEAQRP